MFKASGSVTRYSFRGMRVCDLEDVMLGPRFTLGQTDKRRKFHLKIFQGTSRLPVWGFGERLVEEFGHKALTSGTGASSNTTVFLRRADIIARDLRHGV